MGFGSTAKKLQSVVDMADDLYRKLSELREQLAAIRETIDTTNERVGAIEDELVEQRAILDAIAESEGIDVEAIATAAEESGGEQPPDDPTGESADETTDGAS